MTVYPQISITQYKLCVLLNTPLKRIKHHREETETHRAEPWLIGLLWCREKAKPFTASKLSGQLHPLQCNNMTVKYTSCASAVLACVWQPFWEKLWKAWSKGVTACFYMHVTSVCSSTRMKAVYVTKCNIKGITVCVYTCCVWVSPIWAATFLWIIEEK